MNGPTPGVAAAAAAAALAAAAKINIALASKGVVIPATPNIMPSGPPPKTYFEELVDINHSRNRALLTRGSTHAQIEHQTGAAVQLRGSFRRIGATDPTNQPPLRLEISADTQDKVDAAVRLVKARMGDTPLKAFLYSQLCPLGFFPPAAFDAVQEISGPDREFLIYLEKETGMSFRAHPCVACFRALRTAESWRC